MKFERYAIHCPVPPRCRRTRIEGSRTGSRAATRCCREAAACGRSDRFHRRPYEAGPAAHAGARRQTAAAGSNGSGGRGARSSDRAAGFSRQQLRPKPVPRSDRPTRTGSSRSASELHVPVPSGSDDGQVGWAEADEAAEDVRPLGGDEPVQRGNRWLEQAGRPPVARVTSSRPRAAVEGTRQRMQSRGRSKRTNAGRSLWPVPDVKGNWQRTISPSISAEGVVDRVVLGVVPQELLVSGRLPSVSADVLDDQHDASPSRLRQSRGQVGGDDDARRAS